MSWSAHGIQHYLSSCSPAGCFRIYLYNKETKPYSIKNSAITLKSKHFWLMGVWPSKVGILALQCFQRNLAINGFLGFKHSIASLEPNKHTRQLLKPKGPIVLAIGICHFPYRKKQ